MQIMVFCSADVSSLTVCMFKRCALSLQIKADKIEIWIYNLHVFRKVACLSSMTPIFTLFTQTLFKHANFPFGCLIRFYFHFISPHSILYLEDTHFSPFLSYIFSVTIIIIIIVISFVCENQNVCSFLFGLAYALPFARQLATTKNVQFIYCFTCSLYAVRILKMHFSLSQHPHNLLLGE